MPTQKPSTKWLCHWFLLMMSSKNSLAQSNIIDNLHRAAKENSAVQPNKVSLRERTVQTTNPLRVLSEPCTAMTRDIITSTLETADLQCETPSGMLYTIPGVDKAWIEKKHLNHELISGITQIDLPPNTMIDEATQTLLLNSEPILHTTTTTTNTRQEYTTSYKAMGTKTVLVVRVEATDTATSLSEAQLASDIFGDGGDPNNLKSQYSACSFGKLELTKARGRTGVSTNIQNGIVTVQLGLSKSAGETAMLNAINSELRSQFSTISASNLADFVMICLPPGVMHPNEIAYAYMNGYRSVFNDKTCREVSTQMHEIGHNLNLHHSGKGDKEYGDKSCMMGYSYDNDDAPYMCFNAAKSWQLGWYSDKAITVRPTPQGFIEGTVELAGIAHYGVTNKNVLIKIEEEQSPWAYFVNYNVGKDMNRGTQMGKDKVLVTLKDTSDEANPSELIAIIKKGQRLRIRNFNDRTGEELTVQWESLSNDVATIYIKLTGPSVPEPTLPPSIAPSVGPSLGPSTSPTIRYTLEPSTQEPTMLPTINASSGPSSRPSQPPSTSPSISASDGPTHRSSQPPSTSPSISASDGPSHRSSQPPSSSPSISESVGPTHLHSQIPSIWPSVSPSVGPSRLPSQTPSMSSSTSPSVSPVRPPSQTPSMSSSTSPSVGPSRVPSQTPSMSPSASPSVGPSRLPSQRPSMLPSISPSVRPSHLPSQTPTMLPSIDPSMAPSMVPSLLPSDSNAPSSSMFPSSAPSHSEAPTLTRGPTQAPSVLPSLIPSQTPSGFPSFTPSQVPSGLPSFSPSQVPSGLPSVLPSQTPSGLPSFTPSQVPSIEPSLSPSLRASQGPSLNPSQAPSQGPSLNPSQSPTRSPSFSPSQRPSKSPTVTPSRSPSQGPSLEPSQGPSKRLSTAPPRTESPTQTPSTAPSTTPSAIFLELETRMTLQIPGNVGSSTVLKMCDEVEAHLDSKLKEIYGPSSQTSVECRPDDPVRRTLLLLGERPMIDRIYANETVTRTKKAKQNITKTIEDNITNPIVENITIDEPEEDITDDITDDGEADVGVVTVNVVATTFFPQRSAAPFQADFDSYVFHTIADDELGFLPKGFSMQSDDSSYPPVLRLAASSAMATPTIPGYIFSSFAALSVLFLLL